MTGPQRQIARPSWPTRAGLLALVIASLISWSLAPAARAQGHVYWAWGTSINPFDPAPSGVGRANLDGTGVDQNFITFHGNPIAIAVDDAHVYWLNTDIRASTIGRANLDGTGVVPDLFRAPGALFCDPRGGCAGGGSRTAAETPAPISISGSASCCPACGTEPVGTSFCGAPTTACS